MSTLAEILDAAVKLPPGEQRELFVQLLQRLQPKDQPLPPPRSFTRDQMRAWIEDDEAGMRRFRGKS